MKRILLISYGGAHAEALLPVIKALSHRTDFDLTVLALTTSLKFYQDNDVEVVGLDQFLKRLGISSSKYIKLGQRVIKRFKVEIRSEMPEVESELYYGIGWIDLVNMKGARSAKKIFSKIGRKGFFPVHTMQLLLKVFSPDLVVTTNSPRFEKAAVLAASSLSLPVFVVVPTFVTLELDWLKSSHYGCRVFVFHESVKSDLVAAGRIPEQIIVSGNPSYCELQKTVHNLRSKSEFSDASGSLVPRVLYLAQPELLPSGKNPGGDENRLSLDVVEELVRLDRAGLCEAAVRFHPSQSHDGRLVSVKLRKVSNIIPLSFCADQFDLVVTSNSSAGVQLQLVGLGLVEIGWSILSSTVPFERLGVVEFSKSLNELESSIQRCWERLNSMSGRSYVESRDDSTLIICGEIEAFISGSTDM